MEARYHVMDGAAMAGQLQHVVPVPPAFTALAVQSHVVEERQLDLEKPRPLHSAQEPWALKQKSAGATSVGGGERPPDGVEHADAGGGVGTRGTPDGALPDADHRATSSVTGRPAGNGGCR